jgi:hypothetical protein
MFRLFFVFRLLSNVRVIVLFFFLNYVENGSVVDRHRFDADPDPDFYFHADMYSAVPFNAEP